MLQFLVQANQASCGAAVQLVRLRTRTPQDGAGALAFWRFASFCLGRRWREGWRGRAEQQRLHIGGRHARCGDTCSSAVGWDFRRLPPDRISHLLDRRATRWMAEMGISGGRLDADCRRFARHWLAGGFQPAEASPALLCCSLVCAPTSGALSHRCKHLGLLSAFQLGLCIRPFALNAKCRAIVLWSGAWQWRLLTFVPSAEACYELRSQVLVPRSRQGQGICWPRAHYQGIGSAPGACSHGLRAS